MQLVSTTWYARAWAWTTGGFRAALSRMPSLRSRPTPVGISSGMLAGKGSTAESDLAALAMSPVVYAAILHRALSMARYPIRALEGYGMGERATPIDRTRAPWVGALMHLLERPDPADEGALAPQHTGEALLSQIVTDLVLTGVFYVAPILSPGGEVVGLTRLHPRLVRLAVWQGEEQWVYAEGAMQERRYPRRAVFFGTLPSWSATAQGELGVGAGTPLAPLVDAERTALIQTAASIRQGGADVMITGKDPQTKALLGNKAARDQIVTEAIHQLGGAGEGRRVFALGGDLSIQKSGLEPADIRAPELLDVSRASELMATGTTPVAIGAEAGAYSEAVAQYRVQADKDEQVANVIEASLLRPLAQHFARRAGGRWAARADEVTARIDLSTHPGYASVRTDAISRAATLVNLGWSAAQAAEAEGLDLPEPAGEPRAAAPVATPSASTTEPAVARPKGEGRKPAPKTGRTLIELFGRRSSGPSEWEQLDARRAAWDARLATAAEAALRAERDAMVKRATMALEAAWHPREARNTGVYGAIDMDAVLGDYEASLRAWMDTLSPEWGAAWDDYAAGALDHLDAESMPAVVMRPSDFAPLETSARHVTDWTRLQVRATVLAGLDQGMPPADIARELRDHFAFSPERALRIARTDSAAADSSGTIARGASALAAGADIEQEWISDPSAAQWDRRHDLTSGQRVPVGGVFTLHSGITTRGPGLSMDVGENANCRCGVRLRKVRRAGLTVAAG